jgi:hypothetical protein
MYTGYTQKNGAVSIVFTFETAPLFCVCPVYIYRDNSKLEETVIVFLAIGDCQLL